MKYVIYDTNEYLKMVGRADRPFDEIEQAIARLHQCESRLHITPILNTTVAYELIQHLNSNKSEEQEKYIRACCALYVHCCNPIICVTKNPFVSYIEEKTRTALTPVDRTMKFLEALHSAPTVQTIAQNKEFIIEVENYLRDLKADFLANLQVIRNQYQNDDQGNKEFLQMIDSRDYLQYRTNAFLCSVCMTCKRYNIPMQTQWLSGIKATQEFLKKHRAHIEIWRVFDGDYARGRYNLNNLKTANTGLDAEICYYIGDTISDCSVGVVTEEKLFHRAAKRACLSNLVYSISHIKDGNRITMILKDCYYSLVKKVQDFIELRILLLKKA